MQPKLNLKWYKEDLYSDGKIEDVILELIDKSEPESYSEAILQNFSWPVYYHLSELRKNILNWYDFKKNSNALEIGCGMGAITSVLCDKCDKVTSVELSKRRATATQHRCRDNENLEIIVGNLNDIVFEEKFDYITLIGVLEYQNHFTNSENPFVDFLIKIKSLLKPNGKLLIAIENKLGLKYWCGTPEDHTGLPFDGLNQYKMGSKVAQTFNKNELENIISSSGFEYYKFYYPMPDYKFPLYIYTDEYLPKESHIKDFAPYNLSDEYVVINEQELYKDLLDNSVFEFFSNSYLVECALEKEYDNAIFVATTNARKDEYAVQTIICKDGNVKKKALKNSGYSHIEDIHNNLKELNDRGVRVVQNIYSEGVQTSDYVKLQTLEEHILEQARLKNKDEIVKAFKKLYEEILKSSETRGDSEGILEKGYIDMLPRNCFFDGSDLIFFDQEYCYPNIPVKYIICRAIGRLYANYSWLEEVYSQSLLIEEFGYAKDIDSFMEIEKSFMEDVQSRALCTTFLQYRKEIDYKKNINKLGQKPVQTNILLIKHEIDRLIKEHDIKELYQFFLKNKLENINDKEIINLQKILEIYAFEMNNNTKFSFDGLNCLQDMVVLYYKAELLLELILKSGNDSLKEELKSLNLSFYACAGIIEFEFNEQDKGKILNILKVYF